MKIGEFAEMNSVTAKMLRYYDEIGLLKPSEIDSFTGYRSYSEEQSRFLNWIIILKNLDFSLTQIKEMLNGPIDGDVMIRVLVSKRIEITKASNEQIQKKIAIDKLIRILEKEGFQMDKQIDLMSIGQESVHDIKKNMPNMETFLEEALNILALSTDDDTISVFRLDISHFKQVNDDHGFEVGDRVIVVFYEIIKSNMEKYLQNAALGRAHGDEFIVLARARRNKLEQTAQGIIMDLEAYDFNSVGCSKQMGCYIGGLISRGVNPSNIRSFIDASNEVINHARKKGKNSIAIEAFEA